MSTPSWRDTASVSILDGQFFFQENDLCVSSLKFYLKTRLSGTTPSNRLGHCSKRNSVQKAGFDVL